MENKLPPLHNPFALPYSSTQHEDKKEPHILFMPHDLSRRMRMELDKRNMSFEEFVMQSCKEYIKNIEEDNALINQCFEMQPNQAQSADNSFVSVSLNSTPEDTNEVKQLAHDLRDHIMFRKPSKNYDHEPLIKEKKRKSKDNKHWEKK